MAVLKFGNGNVGKISVIEPYDDNIGRIDYSPEISTGDWIRPSGWLDMPNVSEGVAVLLYVPSGAKDFGVGLFARNGIYTNCPTYIPIDWGDGHSGIFQGTRTDNINYFGNFGTQYKKYDFDLLPESSQIEINGFLARQVIIQLDGSISGITFFSLERMAGAFFGDTYDYGKGDYYTDEYGNESSDNIRFQHHLNNQSSTVLDVVASGANIDDFTITSSAYQYGRHKNCQRIIANVGAFTPRYKFHLLPDLRHVEFPSGATAGVSNFEKMFWGAYSLKNPPFFDTSSATGVRDLFSGAHSLQEVPEYDFSNVTDFWGTFHRCLSLKEIPNLDFSNGKDFYATFSYNHQLTSLPSGFSFVNATGCRYMFQYCYNLKTVPKLVAPNLTNTQDMFYWCQSLRSKIEIDCPSLSSVTNMFWATHSIKQIHIKKLGPITDFTSFVRGCINMEEFIWDNSKQETSSGINFNEAFAYNYAITSYPEMDTSSATGCRSMFNSNYSVKKYQTFDLSNCTYTESMFNTNYALTDVSFKNVQNKVNANSMFNQCWNLRTAPSGFFEGYDSTPFFCPNMFNSCFHLIDASHYIISGITNTSTSNRSVFSNCHSLKKPPAIINSEYGLRQMFERCESLESVSYDLSSAKNSDGMFNYCYSLNTVNIPTINTSIGFNDNYLGSGNLTDIINNLASGVTGQTLDIRYNYGVYHLHPDTLAIATSKGWTVLT